MVIEDNLYRNFFDETLLRCVTQEEAQIILHEFHYGFSRGHYSGTTAIIKILQVRSYWPTIFQDAYKIT